MCPACLSAAAIAALKVACAGGLTAYGVKKAVEAHQSTSPKTFEPSARGTENAISDNRHS